MPTALLSVIVCTHNPRPDYLRRTLDALAAQTLPVERWELLLIDNASTKPLTDSVDLSWHPRSRLLVEKTPGLTAARLCGIAAAAAPILLFVDDDNELSPHYLATTLEIFNAHPRIGCIGAGVIRPEFETIPPQELKPYLCYLALREIAEDRWSNRPEDNITPWGAGLAVRADVARRYSSEMLASPLRSRLDRSGSSLLSGGDDEFTWVACAMGYGKGLFSSLGLTHLISAKRVEKDYLLRLVEGVSASHAILAHLHGITPGEDPPVSLLSALSLLLRGRLASALLQANRALVWRRTPALERAFATAVRRGREKARAIIASV